MLPPSDSDLFCFLYRSNEESNLDIQKLDIGKLNSYVAGDHNALIQNALENIGEVGCLSRCSYSLCWHIFICRSLILCKAGRRRTFDLFCPNLRRFSEVRPWPRPLLNFQNQFESHPHTTLSRDAWYLRTYANLWPSSKSPAGLF